MNAILKTDSNESPQCVFNEKVATNLAQTLHIPNAAGVLADMDGPTAFASLEIAHPGINLPNIRKSWIQLTATTFPNYVAALVAFDILIGNTDRFQNIKVSLFTPHMEIFTAFDHSHALLQPCVDPAQSITQLQSPALIADTHTFYGLVKTNALAKWALRISTAPDYMIEECCIIGKPLNSVNTHTQKQVADALVWRKNNLPQIIRMHAHTIRSVP
ncbi:MAG: hypothetical protein R8K20_10725 [Gallionellaceae bacterium]